MVTLHQIMLYAVDQEKIARFWIDNLGFQEVGRQNYGDTFAIELADGSGTTTKLVLQNKVAVAARQPELTLATPSILLQGTDLPALHARLKAAGGFVGDLVTFPGCKQVFNFADPESNYFAIIEA
ncbi:MAG: VOC family protein [Spirochaetales bacterium]